MEFWKKLFGKDHNPNLISHDTPLENIKFVCLDTETSSLDHTQAELLSIGLVTIQNLEIKVESGKELFIKHQDIQLSESIEVHGITLEKCKNGISLNEALSKTEKYIEKSVLVAHNGAFDLAMLNRFNPKMTKSHRLVDTARLAIRLNTSPMDRHNYEKKDYFLDTLLTKYDIQPLERHTALGDAYSTALLFLKLVKIQQLRGATQLRHIM
ncbi:3'-5' exonuclease [Fulvivirga lutea]|uniref:3'-5' exonuclease n=1 Tax=Fulvivirga lutea TaxID=2810512 RepID=A0A975A1I1_9BACT|nr:3'-5' exonuclease [Fulvivirga lutea]QSE98469.1 3'-5' exonuclease [Fulvivirga lutea]